MNVVKRNLYIVGPPGVGKSFLRKMLEEIIFSNRNLHHESYGVPDWIINRRDLRFEVDIKEFRSTELLPNMLDNNFESNIIIYIPETIGIKTPSINSSEINIINALAEKSTLIMAYSFGRESYSNRKLIKSILPNIEFFISLPYLLEDENSYLAEFGVILRQIIINTHPESLDFARSLIIDNFKTKEPFLDLGNCGITSLNDIKELFENIHLKELILSNEWGEFDGVEIERKTSKNSLEPNLLFELPQELGRLQNLEVLIAGGNWKNSKRRKRHYFSNWSINNIEVISTLKALTTLNLSNNTINNTDPLASLSNLKRVYLNNNIINTFPDIKQYPKLEVLYLSNNNISNVEFLSFKSNLKLVDLHSNQISDLTPIRELIKKINISDSKWDYNIISIANNPLSIPPAEVVAKGKDSVNAYFMQLEAEQEIQLNPFNNADIKLILVGNSNVGKSTFVHWLKTNKVDKTIPTTHWLDLGIWKAKKDDKEYTVRIFDFGGQEYYHDTHHLFFTNRTAYTLIWDRFSNRFDEIVVKQKQSDGKNKEVKIESFPLEYWLDSIRYHTQKRKLSKAERSITKILYDRDKEILYKDLVGKDVSNELNSNFDYKKIYLEYKYQNKIIRDEDEQEEENILVLQNKVDSKKDKVFINQEIIKKKFPKIYDFEDISIYKKKKLKLSKEILFDIFDSLDVLNRQFLGTWNYIKQDIEITDFKESYTIERFLDYCNSIIIALPELVGKSKRQQNKVFFSINDAKVFASFLSDIGLCLYFPENPELKDKVFINQKNILKDLNDILLIINKYTGEITESLIAKTLNEVASSSRVKDVVDLMLHFKILFKHPIHRKKSFIAPLYLPNNPPNSIKLFQDLFEKPVYRFKYKTFIHKSIILDFFNKYGSKALSENSDEGTFFYWKNGIVIKSEICNDIAMVKFIPWNSENKCALLDIYAINGTNEGFIAGIVNYIDKINDGIIVDKLVPNESQDEYIPLEIIHQNEENENSVFHYNNKYYKLVSFKKYLKSPLKMKKIFISYSKQDLKLVNKFIEHLSALQKDGKVAHWYCSELEAGSAWNNEIQKHFDESDIACFMVSPNFMKTDYIHEHEIKKAFERKATDPNFKIVPIILNFCRWTTTNNNLGDYTALPYTAKPVMDFNNQDMAWYIIEASLRVMIDNDINPTDDNFYSHQALPSDVLKIYERIIAGKVDNDSL